MGWLVVSWGERWGTSGMGRTDRCAALCNAKGVVSTDRLEGHAVDDGFYGHRGLEFGTTGFWAWSTPMQQASPKVNDLVWGVTPFLRLTMSLAKKNLIPSYGSCWARSNSCGLSMIG